MANSRIERMNSKCPKCQMTSKSIQTCDMPGAPTALFIPEIIKNNHRRYNVIVCNNPNCGYMEVYLL